MNLINKKSLQTLTILLLVVAAGYGFSSMQDIEQSGFDPDTMPLFRASKGQLTISISESGTIRPRDQVILRNEMWEDSTILSIVEEGTRVKKGDLICELDATLLEREHQSRELELQNDYAEFVSARENYEVAKNQAEADIEQAELLLVFSRKDLEKYVSGEYPKLVKEAKAKITIAEEELNRAQDVLKWSSILFKEKYLSQTDLQRDELAAQKAELNLELAKEELSLLENYTHERQIAQLKSDVRQAELAFERTKRRASANITDASARYFFRQDRYEEEQDDFREVEEQIKKAKIYAPIDGAVLYASSVMEDWEDDEDRIRVGAAVDERREIIFLTAAEEYNVDIQIQETDLNKIETGQPAIITVDALPGETFDGVVKYVSPLPNQRQQYLNPNLKVYNTDIELHNDVHSLRNGMSCRVEIVVQEYQDVLFVPIQAVMKVNNQPTVFVVEDNRIVARPVEIGLDNNRMIHIKRGLEDGDAVLLKPPLNIDADASPGENSASQNDVVARSMGQSS